MLPDRLDFAVDYVNQQGQAMWDVAVLLDEESDGLVTVSCRATERDEQA